MNQIVKCAIYPPIGIARVGNSPTGWFVGPEVPGCSTVPIGGYKDSDGRLKRQAAKFRVYGIDSEGNAVRELTAKDAEIHWTVHLANKKGVWYRIRFAMDISEAEPVSRRNPKHTRDRTELIIDPGPRSVGPVHPGAKELFDTGSFLGKDVPLGEIRSDEMGRLLVLGGFGNSSSVSNKPIESLDNEEWYDDNSDGPVTAQVRIEGREIEVEPAWVIVAPPDFAPSIRSIVTIYDLAYQVAVKHFNYPDPERVSFYRQVYPIFESLAKLQWVNAGIYLNLGWGATDYFLDPDTIKKLSDNSEKNKGFRRSIVEKFRNPDGTIFRRDALPPIFGDARDRQRKEQSPRDMLSVTQLQYSWLTRWADGLFESDFERDASGPRRLEDLPLKDHANALTQAALENCQGGPFHPGCEAPWAMRQRLMYASPFRIKHKPRGYLETDFGDELTPKTALSQDGPLNGSAAGDLTRWMALPWQVDAFTCGSGFEPLINPHLPTFWPARVPNHVLTKRSFAEMNAPFISNAQSMKHFSHRQDWLRHNNSVDSTLDRLDQFMKEWFKLGIITRQSVPGGIGELPAEVFVEMENAYFP